MRLSLGGTHNLEWWQFSETVKAFLQEHGVDLKAMQTRRQFRYGLTAPNSPAMWFDRDSYGVDRLVPNLALDEPTAPDPAAIDRIPISKAGRESLKALYARHDNLFPDRSPAELEAYLRCISYPEFLRRHGQLTDDAVQLFDKLLHGGWGLEMRALSAMEALEEGFTGWQLLGMPEPEGRWDHPVAMWPDGNASLARLQVAKLIPAVAPGTSADNVALARFDYAALDRPESTVRLRLDATVIGVDRGPQDAAVSYVQRDNVYRVTTRHCVLGCYHRIIPYLCPQLPPAQKDALAYQVKHPLILTNVLIRNTAALDRLGIDGVRCPGRLHAHLFTFRGINTGGYEHDLGDSGPVALVFWGTISPPPEATDVRSQLRASRKIMLGMAFEDYEREVRTVLDGLLAPAGFDVRRDVLAITVNRRPHGYAYDYLDLWDPDWPEGEAPHEIARRPFGNITIANADAAADAYTHAAIDQAFRAVQELPAGDDALET
jgi:spermidine dehydrogenase